MGRRDGGRREGGKKPEGIGEKEKRGKNHIREKERSKQLERSMKNNKKKNGKNLDSLIHGIPFKCQVKVLNTREKKGKNKSGKNYCFVHSAQLGC